MNCSKVAQNTPAHTHARTHAQRSQNAVMWTLLYTRSTTMHWVSPINYVTNAAENDRLRKCSLIVLNPAMPWNQPFISRLSGATRLNGSEKTFDCRRLTPCTHQRMRRQYHATFMQVEKKTYKQLQGLENDRPLISAGDWGLSKRLHHLWPWDVRY
jgi:hypothetical protein